MRAVTLSKKQSGFTLAEALITLILLGAITLMMLDVIKPWFALKAEMETSARMASIDVGLQTLYEPAAFTMETPPGPTPVDESWMALAAPRGGRTFYGYLKAGSPELGPVKDAFVFTDGRELLTDILPNKCNTDNLKEFWKSVAGAVSLRPEKLLRDGHGSPICLILGKQRYVLQGGVPVYYHQLYAVSAGKNGRFDAESKIEDSTGALMLAGDDRGVSVSGLDLQLKKFNVTQERLQNAASIYERYFSMRYLSTNTREVLRNYFVDPDGPISEFKLGPVLVSKNMASLKVAGGNLAGCTATTTAFGRPPCSLGGLGVVGTAAESAWENYHAVAFAGVTFDNSVYMANGVDGDPATPDEGEIRVPNPFPSNPAAQNNPPYTALVFTFIPGPFDGDLPRVYRVNAYGRY